MKSWIEKYSRYIALFLAFGFIIPLNEQSKKPEEEVEETELNLEWFAVDTEEVEETEQKLVFASKVCPVFLQETSYDFSIPTLPFVKTSYYKLFILYSCLMVDRCVA